MALYTPASVRFVPCILCAVVDDRALLHQNCKSITQHRAIGLNVWSNIELLKIEMGTEFCPLVPGCDVGRTS